MTDATEQEDFEFAQLQDATNAMISELRLDTDAIDEDAYDDFFVEAIGIMEDVDKLDKPAAMLILAGEYGMKRGES
jgi:hypothetical protein